MTRPTLPRIALALLERFVPDSTPLAGDLVEEFERRRSRAWVWRQVVVAVATRRFTRSDEIRPLRLVDLQPVDAQRRTALRRHWKPVNLTASPLPGIGGLGLVILALLMTLVQPGAWWMLAAPVAAGILLGVILIARRRTARG
jgi:hypothetical protein